MITAVDLRRDEEEILSLPWALPVRHFSASSLTMAMRCKRQWQERYLHGKKERPGAATTLGSAEWGAHCLNFEQKRDTGEDLSEADLDFAYAESWDKAVAKNGGVDEIVWNEKEKWPDVQAKGLQMARAYHAQVSPRIQPVAVEQKILFKSGTVPAPILGFIDLVPADAPLVEHKTSSKAVSKPKPAWRMQHRIYSSYTRQPLQFHIVTKAAVTKILTPLEEPRLYLPFSEIEAKQTEKLVDKVAWLLNYLYLTLGPDEPWPTDGEIHDWACDWCGFRGSCPAWRR